MAQSALRAKANPEKAKVLQGFFKTGPGQYGEGDVFLGLVVPQTRAIARQFADLPFEDLKILLRSQIHEERLLALYVLVSRFEKGEGPVQKAVFQFYIKNLKGVNNWDLVDSSAHLIVGEYLAKRDWTLLDELVVSKNLWKRRVAIVSTLAWIRKKQFEPTLRMAKKLIKDNHDLIHKAVGWMLREVGKRDRTVLVGFLGKYYRTMPRTMLRYAIEHFPESQRKSYLNGSILDFPERNCYSVEDDRTQKPK